LSNALTSAIHSKLLAGANVWPTKTAALVGRMTFCLCNGDMDPLPLPI